jgi:hypothetical protein
MREVEPDGSDVVDLRVVVAEVYDDVERRRAAGTIPPGLVEELDAAFARLAPPGAVGGDLGLQLARAERAAFVDVDVPVASALPGASFAKRAIRKAVRWYLRYLAEQVTALGGAVVRALRVLDDRLAAVEQGRAPVPPRVASELALVERPAATDAVVAAVTGAVAGVGAPAVVAECGRGELVRALVAAGVAASGVEPRRALVGDALRGGLDVVVAAADAHLGAQVPATLGAVVLVGVVDREPVGAQLALADHAVAALAPDGRLVVVVTDRAVWASPARAVEADLAPGHPLQPSTWQAVLGHLGLVDVATTSCGDAAVVVARRPPRPVG